MYVISVAVPAEDIQKQHNHFFKDMIKAVVDIRRNVIAVDAELHADLEGLLLGQGSAQEDMWGINLYLQREKPRRIECTALINIRPWQGNSGMEIADLAIVQRIREIVDRLIL